MSNHDSGPLLHSNPATAAAWDKVELWDSRRRQRIGKGELAVDKADFDDDVLPELSDSSDSSDSANGCREGGVINVTTKQL
jgi:hypothetical protein